MICARWETTCSCGGSGSRSSRKFESSSRISARAAFGSGEIRAEQQSTRDRDVLDEIMRTYHTDMGGRTALEDRIGGLLEMDPGDLILHCAHHRMAMKSAEILVFWNGALRPLKDCADDALVGSKLESILESHQNLWAIRAFVNPDFQGKRDALAGACDYLFCYEAARKRRFAGFFYGSVIDKLSREKGLSVSEHEAHVHKSVERLLAVPEQDRTLERAKAIVAG